MNDQFFRDHMIYAVSSDGAFVNREYEIIGEDIAIPEIVIAKLRETCTYDNHHLWLYTDNNNPASGNIKDMESYLEKLSLIIMNLYE